ncbi:hypothetical protein Tco_1226965 [Tanacetum coccineum]
MKNDFEVEYDLKDEILPKVDDVSLVDGVFEGAFDGDGDGDEDFVMGEGVSEEDDGEDDEENEGDKYLIKVIWFKEVKHGMVISRFQKVFKKM